MRAVLAIHLRRARDHDGPVYDIWRRAEACKTARGASHPPGPAQHLGFIWKFHTAPCSRVRHSSDHRRGVEAFFLLFSLRKRFPTALLPHHTRHSFSDSFRSFPDIPFIPGVFRPSTATRLAALHSNTSPCIPPCNQWRPLSTLAHSDN